MSKPQTVMLVSIALAAAASYSMHGVRLHKTSRRDAMARDPRRDRDETFAYVSRPSRDRDVSTETTSDL